MHSGFNIHTYYTFNYLGLFQLCPQTSLKDISLLRPVSFKVIYIYISLPCLLLKVFSEEIADFLFRTLFVFNSFQLGPIKILDPSICKVPLIL